MMPRVNRRKVKSPASGRSAWAACAAVRTSVIPCTCRVEAVVRMMKKAAS